MNSGLLLSFNIILPLIAALASFIKSSLLRKIIINIIGVLLVINNVLMLSTQDNNSLILLNILDQYQLSLVKESFAVIFALMVSILYCCTNLYSFAYLRAQEYSEVNQDLHPQLYFFFTPIAIMASLNIGYSANLLTLFIFYELLTLSTYPLVIQSFSEHAQKAGRDYLRVLFVSSSFFLLIALIWLDNNYGATSFQFGGIFNEQTDIKEILLLLICFIFGFSKTAIFPLHIWLPRAMVAPVPVSALLHAVAVVKSGIFALIKVFIYLFGINNLSIIHAHASWIIDWITLLAGFTVIYAGFMACLQDNLKKLLAYSTIGQLSCMILTLSFTNKTAVMASFLHMLSHSVAKISLFFTTGIIYICLHQVKLTGLQGVARILPIPVLIFIIAALSTLGFPFTAGYITGMHLYEAIPHNGFIGSIAMSCLLIGKLLACYYFARVILIMLSPAPETSSDIPITVRKLASNLRDECAEYTQNHLSTRETDKFGNQFLKSDRYTITPTYLTWVTVMTLLFSAVLIYYLEPIENYLQ